MKQFGFMHVLKRYELIIKHACPEALWDTISSLLWWNYLGLCMFWSVMSETSSVVDWGIQKTCMSWSVMGWYFEFVMKLFGFMHVLKRYGIRFRVCDETIWDHACSEALCVNQALWIGTSIKYACLEALWARNSSLYMFWRSNIHSVYKVIFWLTFSIVPITFFIKSLWNENSWNPSNVRGAILADHRFPNCPPNLWADFNVHQKSVEWKIVESL